LGAEQAICYQTTPKFSQKVLSYTQRGVDVILDPVLGGPNFNEVTKNCSPF
jgi:NADPH:quinone reductase-like Zn-dependent oxidoreductase